MNRTKDFKMDVMGVHNLFWESYARRDIDLRFSLCSEDVTFIGSGLHERALNKTEYKNINKEGVKQFPDPFQIEFLWTNIIMLSENVACIESEVVWSQLINNEMTKELLRNTTLLKRENNKWLVTHVHGSVPDYRLKDGDYMTNEQTIIRNRELERQVFERTQDLNKTLGELEHKNRELEIESALEKVRSSALAMIEPADMLEVCHVISDQLQLLGVNNIRNVQTAIIHEQKSTYLNYQYFAAYNQSVIEEAEYNKHPKAREMAETMQKSIEAFFSQSFNGEELNVFRNYRKQDNQLVDPILDDASSIHFYFYSIGPGALGLSTYNFPLSENELNILKRFRNVFELAYRRFIDIEQAIAQAREAQIELALERVRARTMAMQKSEELKEVIRVVYEQFVHLKINVDHAGFVVDYTPKGDWHFWIADEQDIPSKITHPYFESVWASQFNEAKEKGADFFATNLNFEEKNKFYNELLSYVPGLPKASKDFYLSCPGLAVSTALFDSVSLYIENFSGIPYTDEENNTLMRFGKVFQQTYTRFLDLQKAEAQAREAQIEAALERVRSRTMAMHKSDELRDASLVLYQQMKELGEPAEQLTIGIVNEPENVVEVSATLHGDVLSNTFGHSIEDPLMMQKIFKAWKTKEKRLEVKLTGESLKKYNEYRNSLLGSDVFPTNIDPDFYRISYMAFFSKGFLALSTNEPRPPDSIQILERFSKAFDLTYTRFLDLQKAETQAREAQIEAALERVRAKAMAMHTSNDLSETMGVLFRELPKLGINSLRCGVVLLSRDSLRGVFYAAASTPESDSFTMIGAGYMDEHPVFMKQHEHWLKNENYFTSLSNEELESYYKAIFARLSIPYTPRGHKVKIEHGYYFAFTEGMFYAWAEEPYSDDEINILNRFKAIIDLTFRRYLDLKKAEAQAREANIEVSLERVRSKAMAMHSPNDLSETVNVFFKELKTLGIIPIRCGVGKIDGATRTTSLTTTTSSQQGESFRVIGKVKQTGHPVLDGIFDHWKLQQEYYPVLEGEDIKAYYDVMNPQIGYPEYPEGVTQYGNCFFFKEGFVFAWTESKLSEEELQIFRRFTSVLSLTYRRFLDLTEAEEKNKIIQAENERKTKELEEARQLQLAMLPKSIPEIPNLDIAVYMKTATEVGGDYYDFKVQKNGVLNIGIGDATGHGLQAGTMITLMKGFFTSDVTRFNPQKFLEHCNGMIRDIKLGRILMSFSHLRFNNNSLLISSAGMPPIYYHHKKNNRTEEIIIQGLPLGALGSASYKLVEKQLSSGDTILLLTDGLPEQMNSHKVIFDYSRVLKYFDEIAENTPNDIINCLVQKANEWMESTAQVDDITFVVIQVK